MKDVIDHYDKLIDENNDPTRDPKPLRDYMDKWDGEKFVESMKLNKNKYVLEIGVGTGRIAIKVAPLCRGFIGIDISPKTIARAKQNFFGFPKVELLCGDFLTHDFGIAFDVIYSSLTFMHIEDKQEAINKVATLLNAGGRFVLSIDKNLSTIIDTGISKILIYPDTPEKIERCIGCAGLKLKGQTETEFACIFIAEK